MTYSINFTDKINKNPIVVNDSSINTQTNLQFPGRNARGYGIAIAENFLHLLENFARDNNAPGTQTGEGNAVVGQLWYDSAAGVKSLKVFDGQIWKPVGVAKNDILPTLGNIKGDLTVDTTKQQLYLWNGTQWVLIGPGIANGIDSGTTPEIIKDIFGNPHVIVKTFVYNQFTKKSEIVSITSLGYTDANGNKINQSFTPSPPIDNFGDIKPGVNLRTVTNNKFWGVSEKAENLIDATGTSIPTASFLRTDLRNTVIQDFIIKNDTGLSIGADSTGQLKLQMSNNVAVISHTTSPIEIRINNGTTTSPIIRFDTNGFRVGINTITPSKQLDVKGTGGFSDKVEITSTTDVDSNASLTSSSTDQSALSVWGGVAVKKKIHVGDDAIIDGQIYINYPQGTAIVPAVDNIGNPILDIGSSTAAFRNIYANRIYANITGSITGDITGNASTANRLTSQLTLNMTGDITSDNISFYGTERTLTFTTSLSPDYIDRQHETATGADSDLLLIYREGLLYKTAKSNFVSSLATVPIGSIIPFAGSIPPAGYLFCDGSEKSTSTYNKLFNVIKYQYGVQSGLKGYNTFRLPDLRGRFPVGVGNMDNINADGSSDTVIDASDPRLTAKIPAGGGVPTDLSNRVNDSAIYKAGAVGGNETTNITQNNLPMTSIDSATGTGSTRESYDGAKTVTGLPIVNPYLSINYLIYAGA
jgi:microcystin-dependent protein